MQAEDDKSNGYGIKKVVKKSRMKVKNGQPSPAYVLCKITVLAGTYNINELSEATSSIRATNTKT